MEENQQKERVYPMLFRRNIERYCAYCQFSGKIDDESVVCQFCGVVSAAHHCRRFRYDPLRRVPPKRAQGAKPEENEADFSL